ncbi:MAG: ribosome small subunit-dependent GTPase A [Fimbriimonas sp.]
MNQKERDLLQSKLSLLTLSERNKLYKRAAEMRKRAPAPTMRGVPSRHAPDEDGEERVKVRPRTVTLHDLVLKILLEDEQAETPTVAAGPTGTVLAIAAGTCEVLFGEEMVSCRLTPELRQRQQTDLAVGDQVVLEQLGEEQTRVIGVLPRRTRLSRPDPGIKHRERVVVANVDVVGIVVSVVAPPLHPRLIDRYLLAIRRGGAEPVICVNKVDLLGEDRSELAVLDPFRQMGIPVILCSAGERHGMDELRSHLAGKLSAFVGHSGVGKSSLLNALRPELNLATGEVWRKYGRGTHTTTASTLHDLGDGIRIIDTPGIREFGLWEVTEDELEASFPEFQNYRCRFRDCRHEREPGCAIREAIERGELSEERFATFQKLRRAL